MLYEAGQGPAFLFAYSVVLGPLSQKAVIGSDERHLCPAETGHNRPFCERENLPLERLHYSGTCCHSTYH
jgi:hypothetical protein